MWFRINNILEKYANNNINIVIMFQDIINNNIIIMTQKQSAPIECKNNLFKLVYSVKTTAYDQNSNIHRYFHIYKAQNKSD